jgi:hypothetical protein
MPQNRKDYVREYQREYFKDAKHRELKNKRTKLWRENKPDYLIYMRRKMKKYGEEAKLEVLTHYGNNKCACVKCGFDDIRALSIDHIDSNGAEQRKSLYKKNKAGGIVFYKWLKKQGYPIGYQTLCMNCQFIKRCEKREYKHRGEDTLE